MAMFNSYVKLPEGISFYHFVGNMTGWWFQTEKSWKIYLLVSTFDKHIVEKSKCKAPIHTLNPQADPYPRSIPKRRWSRPFHTSGSPRADPYPNFDATLDDPPWRSLARLRRQRGFALSKGGLHLQGRRMRRWVWSKWEEMLLGRGLEGMNSMW